MISSCARAIAILLLTTFIAGCASGAGSTSERSRTITTEHYYGTVTSSSANGKIPMGPPVMTLVRRDIDRSDERITETLTTEGATQITTLRRDEGNTFIASSNDNSIGGSMEFTGDDWNWRSWRYAIVMKDGSGRIEGTGRFDGKWIESEKYFVAPSGERKLKIIDRLVRITPEEYQKHLAEMSVSAPTSARSRR